MESSDENKLYTLSCRSDGSEKIVQLRGVKLKNNDSIIVVIIEFFHIRRVL